MSILHVIHKCTTAPNGDSTHLFLVLGRVCCDHRLPTGSWEWRSAGQVQGQADPLKGLLGATSRMTSNQVIGPALSDAFHCGGFELLRIARPRCSAKNTPSATAGSQKDSRETRARNGNAATGPKLSLNARTACCRNFCSVSCLAMHLSASHGFSATTLPSFQI